MVIEFLTFEVDRAERDDWVAADERHWNRYLENRPGFIGKEIWVEDGDPDRIHAVIRWESMEAWNAVPRSDVAAVDDAMGPWYRDASMRAFRVVLGR